MESNKVSGYCARLPHIALSSRSVRDRTQSGELSRILHQLIAVAYTVNSDGQKIVPFETWERSGDGRGTILDGCHLWRSQLRQQMSTRSSKAEKAEAICNQKWFRRDGGQRRGCMHTGNDVIPPKAGVSFGRVLRCLEIVGHRNDREQDQDKKRQGNKLRLPVKSRARSPSQPHARDSQAHQHANEIED
jgi:hypothetical protein